MNDYQYELYEREEQLEDIQGRIDEILDNIKVEQERIAAIISPDDDEIRESNEYLEEQLGFFEELKNEYENLAESDLPCEVEADRCAICAAVGLSRF